MASSRCSPAQGCACDSQALLLLPPQEAHEQGLEYCGWDVGHVPECRYLDAKYAEAYGVELPAVRRRRRRRQW
jgi:hypothetical protein